MTGLSYDKLLLHSILPTVHASLFRLLTTIINACHAHLLPYTTAIEACIVQTMTSSHERWVNSHLSLLAIGLQSIYACNHTTTLAPHPPPHTHTHSESLTVSVHRCLCAWVLLRKDTDKYFITLTTSTLLKAVDSTTTSKVPPLEGAYYNPPYSSLVRSAVCSRVSECYCSHCGCIAATPDLRPCIEISHKRVFPECTS